MSESSSSAASGGLGVGSVLGIVFVVLKLTHVITWSWWWVTLPFWAVFALLVLVLYFLFSGIWLGAGALYDHFTKPKVASHD